MLEDQRAHEQAAGPAGKPGPGVKGHARGRDRRHPVFDGLGHAGLMGALADGEPGIAAAIGDHRPTVIGAGGEDIDFIAALGAVFDHPDLAGRRMAGDPLGIAVPKGEYFRLGAGPPGEGIARRHGACVGDADDLAGMGAELLGVLGLAPFARGDVEQPVPAEHHARAEMHAARIPGQRGEDHPDVG